MPKQIIRLVLIVFQFVSLYVSKVENTLRPHVKEQVEDGKVRQEAMFLLIHLIVGLWLEIGVWQRVLGTDRLAVIRGKR